MRYTEATLVGVFGPGVHVKLAKPFRGARWRHAIGTAEGFVSDVLTYCGKNVDAEDLVGFVDEALGDNSAVLVIDDDGEPGPRAVVFHLGARVVA